MYTVRCTNDGCEVRYNGNELTNFVPWAAIHSLRAALADQYDPATCMQLRAVFAAQNDYESVPFTLVNDSDYGCDEQDAIDAVACEILRVFEEEWSAS